MMGMIEVIRLPGGHALIVERPFKGGGANDLRKQEAPGEFLRACSKNSNKEVRFAPIFKDSGCALYDPLDGNAANCKLCGNPASQGESLPLSCGCVFHDACLGRWRRSPSCNGRCQRCGRGADGLESVRQMLRNARELMVEEHYERCLEKVQEVLSLDSEQPEALRLRGLLELKGYGTRTDRSKGVGPSTHRACAKADLVKAVGLGDLISIGLLASIYTEDGDQQQARRLLMGACALGDGGAMINLGWDHRRRGNSTRPGNSS